LNIQTCGICVYSVHFQDDREYHCRHAQIAKSNRESPLSSCGNNKPCRSVQAPRFITTTIFLETYFHLYYFNTIIGCPSCPHVQILSSNPTFAPGITEPGHLNVAISKREDFCHRKFKRVIPAVEDQGSTNIQTSNWLPLLSLSAH
jgi:hypothetical protein